jgi:hypothetical protein
MITASEVLGQLTELLADVELVRADADNWRTFVAMAGQRGYGPRLTPGTAAALLPDGNQVAAVVAESQREVGGSPIAVGGKSGGNGTGKRRSITDADRTAIRSAYAAGRRKSDISAQDGYSKSTVERVLAGVDGAGTAA